MSDRFAFKMGSWVSLPTAAKEDKSLRAPAELAMFVVGGEDGTRAVCRTTGVSLWAQVCPPTPMFKIRPGTGKSVPEFLLSAEEKCLFWDSVLPS